MKNKTIRTKEHSTSIHVGTSEIKKKYIYIFMWRKIVLVCAHSKFAIKEIPSHGMLVG